MIVISEVSKWYGTSQVLKRCSTSVDKGEVVERGTHKELLARNKLYRHLHYLEFNQMDEMT